MAISNLFFFFVAKWGDSLNKRNADLICKWWKEREKKKGHIAWRNYFLTQFGQLHKPGQIVYDMRKKIKK
jgi:hypothetical protein